MSFNLAMLLISAVYLILVSGSFFLKERVTNQETKIYKYLIINDALLILFEFLCVLSAQFDKTGSTPFASFVGRSLLVAIEFWITIFTLYIIIVTNKNKSNNIFLNYKYLIISIFIINSILVCFLPLYFYSDGVVAYTYGASTTYLVILIFVAIIINIYCAIKSRKFLEKKKLLPIFAFIISIFILIMIRSFAPQIQMFSAIFTFITILMCFTIENPDVKMIEELVKAHKLSEKTNNDKSNFIYTVSEDINNRLDNAEIVYEKVMDLNPDDDIKEEMENLNNIINGARNMLNSALGISHEDSKYLILTKNKYNVQLLFESIYTIEKQRVKEHVNFRLNTSDDLPKELYGDSIKIKQIISSIIDNSIKYTSEGFIELRVNSFIKNDICRLIISVEDSGTGIDIFKQNEIMSNLEDLTKEEINNLDNKTLNLKTIRKMINLIGGTFTIDNNKYNGTTINVSLNQKIVIDEKSKEEKEIAKYNEAINNQKTCAIISNDKDNIKKIRTNLRKKGYKILEFDVTKNVLDNIRNSINYNLIFIEENMDKIDARSFLKKVKEVDSFNGQIIIISKIKNIKAKKELIDLGFANVIYSPIDKKDILDKINTL